MLSHHAWTAGIEGEVSENGSEHSVRAISPFHKMKRVEPAPVIWQRSLSGSGMPSA
jgi:hypothetical protein